MRHAHSLALTAVLLLGAVAAASAPSDPIAEERDRTLVTREAPQEIVTLVLSELYVDSVDVVSEAVVVAVSRAIAAHDQMLAASNAVMGPPAVNRELLLASLPRSHPNPLHSTVGELSHRWDLGSRALSG